MKLDKEFIEILEDITDYLNYEFKDLKYYTCDEQTNKVEYQLDKYSDKIEWSMEIPWDEDVKNAVEDGIDEGLVVKWDITFLDEPYQISQIGIEYDIDENGRVKPYNVYYED